MYLLGHRQIDNNGLSKQKVRLVMRCCCWVDLIYPFKRASAATCDTHVCAGDLERKKFFFLKSLFSSQYVCRRYMNLFSSVSRILICTP